MSKKVNKQDKIAQEKNQQRYAMKKNQKTIGVVIVVISVLLIASMLLSSLRF